MKYCLYIIIVLLFVNSVEAGFSDSKTFFQTNSNYDSRIAIPVDAVVIHPHGTIYDQVVQIHDSWKTKSVSLGRMFFADSDDANQYWTGKWDGKKHTDEVETLHDGSLQLCAGVRPYMLPTTGWVDYLKSKVDVSIDNGVDAILPEEPLAHVFTGYEEGFKKAWQEHFDSPWQPEKENGYARYLTAQLKGKLYLELEEELSAYTEKKAKEQNRQIDFIIPVHSLYSNLSAEIVAPLGTSLAMEGVDGYIGQVWTGPVRWCLANYDTPNKSFFTSAYVLYDYFVQLTVGTPKNLWLLVDPVEDDPDHKWSEFTEWYKQCTIAMLLMRDTEKYEVMPWPDRIFLPGHATGGGTPAPAEFRNLVLAITQVLQDVPRGGRWLGQNKDYGIGVAVADSAMWQRKESPRLQGIYSMFLPILQEGVTVSSAVMERAGDVDYMDRFKVLVLSYEDWKPYQKKMQDGIVGWVKRGGVLVVLGKDGDELDGIKDFWWQKEGYFSALDALLKQLEYPCDANAPRALGGGWVLREATSPSEFAQPSLASAIYLPLIKRALSKAGIEDFRAAGYFAMKRGDYVIAQSIKEEFKLNGVYVNVFDSNLPVGENITLKKGQGCICRDISEIYSNAKEPKVLQTTYRLIEEHYSDGQLRFKVKGPVGNNCTARLFIGDFKVQAVEAVSEGQKINVDYEVENKTIKVTFPNHVNGVSVKVNLINNN